MSQNSQINSKTRVLLLTETSIIIHFSINSAKDKIIKEVLLYDFNNFVADVGGIFGLLLRLTIYGIIQIAEEFVVKGVKKKTSLDSSS